MSANEQGLFQNDTKYYYKSVFLLMSIAKNTSIVELNILYDHFACTY